jgi:hypothetical protein
VDDGAGGEGGAAANFPAQLPNPPSHYTASKKGGNALHSTALHFHSFPLTSLYFICENQLENGHKVLRFGDDGTSLH